MISIIVPIYKEKNILSFLNSINSINGKKEIIFVGAYSEYNKIEDFKNSLLKRRNMKFFLSEKGNIKFFLTKKGRAIQMNFGAKKSNGMVLLFLHSDTFLPKNSLEEINKTINENKFVAGAFSLKLDSSHPFLILISKLTTLRSKITKIPYGDQAIFIKKSFFEKINGYRKIPLLEDVDLMERIQKNKGKIKISSLKVTSSSRKWKSNGMLYCTFRNRLIILMHIFHISPERIISFFKY